MEEPTSAQAVVRQRGFLSGPVLTGIVSLVAIVAILSTFLANASPYVTVDQALHNSGENLHLAGKIVKSTVHSDLMARRLNFDLIDANGKTISVHYTGEAISNVDEADRVVAIGGVKNGVFESNKLLIKCPSKYGDNQKSATQSDAASSKAS